MFAREPHWSEIRPATNKELKAMSAKAYEYYVNDEGMRVWVDVDGDYCFGYSDQDLCAWGLTIENLSDWFEEFADRDDDED